MVDVTAPISSATDLIKELKDTETGKGADTLMSLIPRTVNAALSKVWCWVYAREANMEATKLLLQKKLKNIDPEKIQEPAAFVAVPALQALSYSMDSDELRNMYANLLSKAMHKDYANTVHPGFVDIIKQLSPFDALILLNISQRTVNPLLNVRVNETGSYYGNTINEFFTLDSLAYGAENVNSSVSNLKRLGLIEAGTFSSYRIDQHYSPLIESAYISVAKMQVANIAQNKEVTWDKGMIEVSPYGKTFVSICLSDFPTSPIDQPVSPAQ